MAITSTKIGRVSINPQGEYQSGTQYQRLDVVTSNGSGYICIQDCVGQPVTNTEYWYMLVQKGDTYEVTEEDLQRIARQIEEDASSLFNQLVAQKTSEFNANAVSKTESFDNNASSKTTDFNDNASSKTTTFNNNATSKTGDFNTNATNKTTSFDANYDDKLGLFNGNATTKTGDFNDNASSKTTAFNGNATDKTTAFDGNATDKTTDFNTNYTNKLNSFNSNAETYEKHIEALEDNFDVATSSNSNDFTITNSASGFTKNIKIGDGPELEQATPMVYECDGTESGDYYFVYDSTNYQFTMPTVENGDLLEFDTTTHVLSLDGTAITTTTASTGTLITLSATPSPDYPQDIVVVEGSSSVNTNNKNLFDKSEISTGRGIDYVQRVNKPADGYFVTNFIHLKPNTTYHFKNLKSFSSSNYGFGLYDKNKQWVTGYNYRTFFNDFTGEFNLTLTDEFEYVRFTFKIDGSNIDGAKIEEGSTATSYVEHKGNTFPITLPTGMFLGKIGTASNYIYGTRDNWKLHSGLVKHIFNNDDVFTRIDTNITDLYRFTIDMGQISKTLSDASAVGDLYCTIFKVGSRANTHSTLVDNVIAYPDDNYFYKDFVFYSSETSQMTAAQAKSYLINKGSFVVFELQNPIEANITDSTLVAQLNDILDNLETYKGGTIVFTTSDNLEPNIQFDYMVNPFASIDSDIADIKNAILSLGGEV